MSLILKKMKTLILTVCRNNNAFISACGPSLLVFLTVFLNTNVGQILNVSVFLKPAMSLQDKSGFSKPINNDLRIIVFDDSSAESLQNRPSLDEWIAIANHLAELGYTKIIFPEFYEIENFSHVTGISPSIELVTGGVVHSKKYKSGQTLPVGMLPLDPSYDSSDMTTAADISFANEFLGTPFRIGAVNLIGDSQGKVGYKVGADKFMPHISFFADKNLQISGPNLKTTSSGISARLDDSFYIEHLSPNEIGRASLPVRSFFSKDLGTVRPALSEKLKLALSGGKTALFVIDGNTGSAAFIDSHYGLVPTYYAVASMISSVLNGRLLQDIRRGNLFICFAAIVFFALGLIVPAKRLIKITSTALIGSIVVAVASYYYLATVIPITQLCTLLVLVLFAAQIQNSFHVWHDDLQRQRDLELGKVVQSLTLPPVMAGKIGNWDYEIAYEPFGPMSGDWVQIYRNPDLDHEISGLVAIGDVVGKGPAAALNTASIASLWSHFSAQWDNGKFDIENFLSTLNQNIFRTFSGNQMSSISVALLLKDGIKLINCGSPSWLHITPEITVDTVKTQITNPLGFDEVNFHARAKELKVGPGSIILAHTDGVMDGSAARRIFARNIQAAGLPETDTFSYLKREAVLAGATTVLPDDFTLLFLKKSA